ncbi:hypothetical protein V8E36_006960 [Tilletia maclaganii]
MPQKRKHVDLDDDFEPLNDVQATCSICPTAPVVEHRHLDRHRATDAHQRNMALPASRLAATSVKFRRFEATNAAEAALERQRVEAFPSPSPPLGNEGAAPAREYAPPAHAVSAFDRAWQGMFDDHAAPFFDFNDGEDINQQLLDEVERAAKNVPRTEEDGAYHPWPDRGTFLLSLVAFAPRSPLSRATIELILIFARAIQGYEVPTLSGFRKAMETVRQSGRGAPAPHVGSSASTFYAKSIKSGIARDLASPEVRSRMHLYPRRGRTVKELRDGDAIANSVFRQPIVTLSDGSFAFLHEPTALRDGRIVYPWLWYTGEDDRLRGMGPVVRLNQQPPRLIVDRDTPVEQYVNFSLDDITQTSLLAEQIRGLSIETTTGRSLPDQNRYRAASQGKKVITIPLLVWEDDWRSTTGMGSSSFSSILYSNALLDRQDLDSGSAAVRFYAASGAAGPEEILEAFVNEINDLNDNPFFTYDTTEQDFVLVVPWLLVMLGDSVMLGKLASSVGVAGNRPCRLCDWGGDTAYKHSKEGLLAAMQPGEPRSAKKIKAELDTQVKLARQDNATALQKRWTDTGVKDTATSNVCTILLETNDKVKGKVPPAPGQRRQRLSEQQADQQLDGLQQQLQEQQWYSALHDVNGTAGPPITGLDILHVSSLGPGSQLAALTSKMLDHAMLDKLRVRLEALSTSGVGDASNFPAEATIKHLNTLNGKQVRILAQLMPFALAPLCERGSGLQDLLDAWIAYGQFSKLIYIEYIADRNTYQVELRSAITRLWFAMAKLDPLRLTRRLKLHLLVHLSDQVKDYGPLKNIATERYESYNAIQRQAAMHTNRSAPSKDVATRLETQELVVHWSSGGTIGTGQHDPQQKPGAKITGTVKVASGPPVSLRPGGTVGFDIGEEGRGLPAFDDERMFSPCSSIASQAQDECKIDDFVSFEWASAGTTRADTYKYTVGRIKSILISPGCPSVTLVRAELFKIKKSTAYGVAGLVGDREHAVFHGSRVLQLLNVQHDCIHAGCGIDPQGAEQRQERMSTGIRQPAMHHKGTRGRQQRYVLNELLHRSPAVQHAAFAAVPTRLPAIDLDTIAEKAMETMPPAPRRGRAKKKRREAESVGEDEEFTSSDDEDK